MSVYQSFIAQLILIVRGVQWNPLPTANHEGEISPDWQPDGFEPSVSSCQLTGFRCLLPTCIVRLRVILSITGSATVMDQATLPRLRLPRTTVWLGYESP